MFELIYLLIFLREIGSQVVSFKLEILNGRQLPLQVIDFNSSFIILFLKILKINLEILVLFIFRLPLFFELVYLFCLSFQLLSLDFQFFIMPEILHHEGLIGASDTRSECGRIDFTENCCLVSQFVCHFLIIVP